MALNLERQQTYVVIIRAIYCRGAQQRRALAELARRGAWLSEDQRRQAGVEKFIGLREPLQ